MDTPHIAPHTADRARPVCAFTADQAAQAHTPAAGPDGDGNRE
ncbi:hypothetical protein [Kitasatospora purpeofusca]